MTRGEAWEIVKKYVKNENLRRHMLVVEAGMAKYWEYFNEEAPHQSYFAPEASGLALAKSDGAGFGRSDDILSQAPKYRDRPKNLGPSEEWQIVGLLHDFDWEIHPTLEEHPQKGEKILADLGVAENLRRAILSHAEHSGVPRVTLMEKALFAVDELTGLIVATALVKGKKLENVAVDSILKRWKQKSFAAGVNRQDIERGAEDLGVPLEKHIEIVLEGMKKIAPELGL